MVARPRNRRPSGIGLELLLSKAIKQLLQGTSRQLIETDFPTGEVRQPRVLSSSHGEII